MNELIEKLAEQADWDDEFREDFDIKKFAELIIRECSNMCYKASQESFRLNEVKAGAMGMALKVLMEEHFGVEE